MLSMIIISSLIIFSPRSFCLDGVKMAVINMERVIKSMKETEKGEAFLREKIREFEAEQNELLQKEQKLREEFEKAVSAANDEALSQDARAKKLEEARKKEEELRSYQKEVMRILKDKREELTENRKMIQDRILSKVTSVINDYAKKNGYLIVIDRASSGISGIDMVLYADDSIDITDKIIELLVQLDKEKKE